jgi:hypothetical protein
LLKHEKAFDHSRTRDTSDNQTGQQPQLENFLSGCLHAMSEFIAFLLFEEALPFMSKVVLKLAEFH